MVPNLRSFHFKKKRQKRTADEILKIKKINKKKTKANKKKRNSRTKRKGWEGKKKNDYGEFCFFFLNKLLFFFLGKVILKKKLNDIVVLYCGQKKI